MSATRRPEFRPNELFETLLRIRRDQPRRYAREVSEGMRRRVQLYSEAKARAAAPRARAA